VDRVHGRPGNEGIIGQDEISTRKGARGNRKHDYNSTSRAYGNHFVLVEEMCISGETKGPTKYPSIKTKTKVGRSSKDYWRIRHCSR